MITRSKAFYALLFGVAVAIPMVGHTVTLPTATKTPCFFGALGSSTACAPAAETDGVRPMARTVGAVTPKSSGGVTLVAETAEISRVVTSADTPKVAPVEVNVASVPLPLAGGLLLGSLGFMVVAVRKKSRKT